MEIIRGTTPTIVFTFETITPQDIVTAYLVIKQFNRPRITKPLSDADVTESTIEWTLTQDESLSLTVGALTEIHCDWVTIDDLRGSSRIAIANIISGGKEEVI